MAVTGAHTKKVYASAASTAPSGSAEIAGVTDCSVSRSIEAVDVTAYKDGQYRTRLATLIDAQVTISGNEDMSDAPQGLLRSYLLTGATLYITVLDDGTNGYTYPCVVTSYETGGAVADANTFSATCQLNGTPTARP